MWKHTAQKISSRYSDACMGWGRKFKYWKIQKGKFMGFHTLKAHLKKSPFARAQSTLRLFPYSLPAQKLQFP